MQCLSRVVWALEKVPGRNWNIQVECLRDSALNWKRQYPEDYLVLYVDRYTKENLDSFEFPKVFSEINVLDYDNYLNIETKVFWASIKLRVLNCQKDPFIFLDNDFIVRKDIKKFLNSNSFYFNFLEHTRWLYPGILNSTVRNLKLPFRLKSLACNTSFLYVPDVEFIVDYSKTVLEILETLSLQGESDSTFMLFAEQQCLYAMLLDNQQSFGCLSKEVFESFTGQPAGQTTDIGIFSVDDAEEYYNHVGPRKDRKC